MDPLWPKARLRARSWAGSQPACLSQQHRISGTPSVEVGGFYGGRKQTLAFQGRIEVSPRLGIEPNISQNWIDCPQGGRSTLPVKGTEL